MHRKKFRYKKNSEAGVALIFALAILALLLIMLIGFLASSLVEQRIAYTYGDAAASRLMARGLLVRIQNQLTRPSDAIIWMRNRPADPKLLAPIVSIADDGSLTDGESSNDKAADNGEKGDAYQALKPLLRRYMGGDYSDLTETDIKKEWHWRNFFPNGVKVDYPQWIYYYNNPDKDIITGRAAYVIIPNFGIDPTLLDDGTEPRIGAEYPELSLKAFATDKGVTTIQKRSNWLSLDWLLGKDGVTNNDCFDFTEISQDFYAGKLGAKDKKSEDSSSEEAYREFASLYFTPKQEIAAERSDLDDKPRKRFDYKTLQSFDDYKKLLDDVQLEPSSARNQIAANLRDYMDSDDTPTSDITPSEWVSSSNNPSYTGNEKTPYVNQIIPAIQVKGVYSERRTPIVGEPLIQLAQEINFTIDSKVFVEAINIYREKSPASSIYLPNLSINITITVYRDLSGTIYERSYDYQLAGSKKISLNELQPNSYEVANAVLADTKTLRVRLKAELIDPNLTSPDLNVTVKVNEIKFDKAVLLDSSNNPVDYVCGITNSNKYTVAGTLSTIDPTTNTVITDKSNEFILTPNNSQKTVGAYLNYSVKDPRFNLDNSEWEFELVRSKAELATSGIPNFGSANSNADAKNEDPTKEKDLEAENDPAKLASAYIRNGVMESPWELGFIHRGQAWQTLNLKSTLDPLTAAGEKVTYLNDGLLWDKLKFTNADKADKFNINYPAGKKAVFMPLVKGLKYHPLSKAINTHELKENEATALSADAEKSLRDWIANKCYKASGNDPANSGSEVYNRYIHRGQLANVITDWAINSNDSPFKGQKFSDINIEELIGKIVPLTRCGENFEYFTVFAVAQSIKDIKGTAYTFNNDGEIAETKTGLNHGGKAESEVEDGVTTKQYDKITNTTYLVARLKRSLSNCENKDSCLHGIHSANCKFQTQVIECYTLSEP